MGHAQGPPPSPPDRIIGGTLKTWDPGDQAWWRIYHLDYRNPDPLFRRTFGPLLRFDHHQADDDGYPREDPDRRSVIYLASDIKTAAAEVFWDQRGEPGDPPGIHVARVCEWHHLVQVRPARPITLLSLLEGDGDDVGIFPELSTGPSDLHSLGQDWARAIYRDKDEAQGIWFCGAHNFGECIVLWDRADALEIVPERDTRLHTDGLWERVQGMYTTPTRSVVKITPSECPRCRELGLR